ncbi:peptidoglycan hydrolase [Saccharopolyspora rhizosphaerae]|uniref:Peptidoglycan hydrolase n=1 Tax=Saccharopolyspora rhizosphaerae TaxID=2492662 RepID=A0A3R8QT07_9PSEU|nr:glycosyl hydrolase family 18 protein [Saccharopolyspora rhizosphaerae]RRO18866.1 peptidoglycan hydrolase [Saccharopolyspora rhizosphaerae]
MRRVLPVCGAALGAVLALVAAACTAPVPADAGCEPPDRTTAMSVPYWNLEDGAETVGDHASELDVVSPWVHGIAPDGTIAAQSSGRPDEDVHLDSLLSAGPDVVPTISNHYDGEWRSEPLTGILHDPARTRSHVEALAQFALDGGFPGIDIDYEDLRPEDGPAFTRFVRELADRLHTEDLRLSVTVAPKTEDESDNESARALDYRALGDAADSVRIMAYDYHWETSDPGPAAPEPWLREVLGYAFARVPADKLVLGIPVYGYDWSEGYGTSVSSARALRLAQRHGVQPVWDEEGGSAWFEYQAAGVDHVVWFEDARSTAVKLRLARELGVRAVHLWAYGPEAPGLWEELDSGWERACP